jgi:hypothetical protein
MITFRGLIKKNKLKSGIIFFCILTLSVYCYWKFVIPTHRVDSHSELIMLGDLDDDRKWAEGDLKTLEAFLADPFSASYSCAFRLDINQNGCIDREDINILMTLISNKGDPYTAEEKSSSAGKAFPRARECYRYISLSEYHPRPMWALPYPQSKDSDILWLKKLSPPESTLSYIDALNASIYSEAVRLDQAWRKRKAGLLAGEKEYAKQKFAHADYLFNNGRRYDLLLALIEMVEDAETLTEKNQPELPLKMMTFRNHLRDILNSPAYADFKTGKKDWRTVLEIVSGYLKTDLDLDYEFEKLSPPRDLTHLENYLQRAEWQYYKSSTKKEDFIALLGFAQHDPRYLRAVSRTTRKLHDINVENHNLPMVLLFREALRIKKGDKKKAIALLDETIRIPYSWIKSIPREMLPGSLALDNFLLPGNKEDGADKSRHWNVFGGICLYKSPQEALDLALRREMQDLRDDNYSEEAMREFFRDMIANLNGMYHIMTVDDNLLITK